MGQRTDKHPPKTVLNVSPVDIYMVTFVDGNSIADTRLVLKAKDRIHFLHPEGIDDKLKRPAKWLQDSIQRKLGINTQPPDVPVPEGVELSENPIGG